MRKPSVLICPARESELSQISTLEKSGEGLFRAAGMDRIADAPAPEPDTYRPALKDGRLLVAVNELPGPHDAWWQAWAATKDRTTSNRPSMESDDVLRIVEPQLRAIGYDVESPAASLELVVLWGPDGETRRAYEADAKREHAPGRETVLEVGGRRRSC